MKRKIAIRVAIGVAVVVAAFFVNLVVMSALVKRPADLGLVAGRLRGCPSKPNCVCTQDTDKEHAIEPVEFSGTAAEALAKLQAVVKAMPRSHIVTADGNYLHVEFTSLVLRFVDDVEFLIDPEARLIHFRSASRVGYSDLGVNRRRMEAIRAAFEKQ